MTQKSVNDKLRKKSIKFCKSFDTSFSMFTPLCVLLSMKGTGRVCKLEKKGPTNV